MKVECVSLAPLCDKHPSIPKNIVKLVTGKKSMLAGSKESLTKLIRNHVGVDEAVGFLETIETFALPATDEELQREHRTLITLLNRADPFHWGPIIGEWIRQE